MTHKKSISIALLSLIAGLAYAGSGCGDCDGDKSDKDGKKSLTPSTAVAVPMGNCGGCDGDKDGDTKTEVSPVQTQLIAGNCGDCGDNKDGDKTGKKSLA